MHNRKNLLFCLMTAFIMILCGCGTEKSAQSFFAMNTYMTFTVYGSDSEEIIHEAQNKVYELEKLWSVTDTESDIYNINNSAGEAVTVNEKTTRLIEFALKMSEKTDGKLDPTLYPVVSAWGFTTGENRIPSKDEITEMLSRTGCENIHISGNTITAENGAMLDMGAVAKGYTGDEISEYLIDRGVKSALLDIGGNIQAIGLKPDGTQWQIGLRNPFSDDILGVLEISDSTVVTSGNYERFFTGDDGRKYGHIIDSETGYPVENGLASVTIIGKEGKVCDALSTALFAMGLDGAVGFYRQNGGFDMIIITEDSKIYVTPDVKFTLYEHYGEMEVFKIE